MRTPCRVILSVALGLMLMPSDAAGQFSLGGVMDFLERLSGPKFDGYGVTAARRLGESPVRLRATAIWHDADEEEDGDEVEISMDSYQLAGELLLPRFPVDIGAGVAYHSFGGDVDDFTHFSIPVYAQVRIPLIARRFRITPMVGYRRFSAFDETDFAPFTFDDVSRDDAEWVRFISFAVEYVF